MGKDLTAAARAAEMFSTGFIVIDLETSGPTDDPQVGIVEIAAIDSQGQVQLNSRLNPSAPILAAAEAVHGLDEEDVLDAPEFDRLYPEFSGLINGKTVAAYGAEHDQRVLDTVCRRFGVQPLSPSTWVDVARLYAGYRDLDRFPGLADACRQEGLPVDHEHRALDDCRLVLALLKKIAGGTTINS